ncbi:fas-binding factor 1 isoform X2 [Meleagris gallopavo]|uniref:fas-binding factor 1 isoform X2 n=1 Tax=Meleagris gallopavo TaxID=9103 RepID=UPI0012AB5003|nr:fas-binding factor 1 isoform X2 [Meleagris gallopavo]
MAAKPKKSLRGSIDDVLGDLLGYDDEGPAKSSQPAGVSSGRAQGSSLKASKKSFLEDDFFSKLPAEDMEAAEESSISDADPQAVLQTLKEMDDMEADLLGMSKPSSGLGKAATKGPEKCNISEGAVKTSGKMPAPEKGESAPETDKKPLSSPPASRQYKKFNFEDVNDPLAGLLSEEEQDVPKKPPPKGSEGSPEKKTELGKEKEPLPPQTPLHTTASARRREELTFEDDDDDLMDVLGFGDGQKGNQKQGKKMEDREEVRPARSKLDELLGRGSITKILERPGAGEHREFKLDKKYQKQPEKEEGWDEEDFVFGAYQPTVATTPEGRPSRRQSVRFSAENSSEPKPDPHSKPPPAASQSPARGSRAGGDWLGLKDEDFLDSEPPSPTKTSPVVSSQQLMATEEATSKPNQLEEDNWLSAALSRKKAQAQVKAQKRSAEPLETPGKGLDPSPPVRHPLWERCPAESSCVGEMEEWGEPVANAGQFDLGLCNREGMQLYRNTFKPKTCHAGHRHPVPWLSTVTQASVHPSEPAKRDPLRDASHIGPAASSPAEQGIQGPASLTQVTIPSTPLQAASQLQAESPPLGSVHERRPAAPTVQPYEDAAGCQAALLSAQARVAELESQVRMLELERTQHKLLLESLQQRHQEDLDLLESAHRSRVKVVEETYGQREERLRREKEQLEAQLLSQSQDAERARADLVAQHKQRVATLEQQSAQELERLRELQRSSVQEMRKDHEEQLQRLKRLKDQEIDAVTSATSHTRSLNGVIEQMERFSSDLHNLSHKVEATHHTTSQELAMGARQRDEQLKVLQDRLSQQQRDMEEERSRLQEVIAKMEARLSEQTRLLEQERWRATAEQSKVESLQRSLEEQRRVMSQQLSMERAELERAKSALLEEQKSVMQKCSEERRKLAVEWAEFHTQQQLSKERMERDIDRALQLDSQREGTIISLAKEQAELKIRSRELKVKEEQLARDRELLDEAWHELRLEKEKVKGAALRIRQQEEEIKNVSKLSAQKYEEGERALQDACRIESEHQARLQVMQQHLEQLKQQEQHLQQERLSMAHQRRQLEQLHKKLPNNPTLLLTTDQDLSASTKGLSSTLSFPSPIRTLPGHRSVDTTASMELHAKLLVLKHRAQQDRNFLEDEQLFLETLKKASYNTSPLSV